jgi:eukaryotic-like serine/threonine-protein kinase
MTLQPGATERVKDIFHAALERAPADRWEYVKDASGGDAALRARVEALLAANQAAGDFLAQPTAPDATGTADQTMRFDEGELFRRLQHVLAGRFSLEREIGRGGMGVVFLARDVALDRAVAIKLLPPALAAVSEHRARFIREARTAAGLSHPNIVPIHGVEEHGDLVFYIMALVDGETLAGRVKRAGPLKPADAARLVQEVAWALGYAHGRGVIHRDVKPDNILLEKGSGRALVSDFGIARVTSAATLSAAGEVMGTLRYMSPEQASGESDVDGRSDLYSLGVTAWFALTGRLPFESPNPSALLAMHLAHPAPPLRSVDPAVPARLAEAIDKCLAKDPAARFASGEALADAIADSKVVRLEVPPSVREFLASARTAAAQLVGLGVVWFALLEAVPRVAARGALIGHPLDPIFAMLGATTVIALILPMLAARAVRRAGMDERDVAHALVAPSLARDGSVEYQVERAERLAKRLAHPLMRLVFAFFAFLLLWLFPQAADWDERGLSARAVALALNFIVNGTLLVALAMAPHKVVALFTRGTKEHAAFLRRLWSGWFGRGLFALAGIGVRRARVGGTAASVAPTEVMLGRAAEVLFEQLPAEQRKRLSDVRDAIAGLERVAVALRERRDELLRAAAEVGGANGEVTSDRRARALADLEAARLPLEARLQKAVSALENIRLDLLRLRAGIGHADDLTQSIEEARNVHADVDRELAAMRETSAALRGG